MYALFASTPTNSPTHAHKTNMASRITATVFAALFALSIAHAPLSVAASSEAIGRPVVNINDGFADLVQSVKPAVVNISTTSRTHAQRQPKLNQQSPELEEFFRKFFNQPPQDSRRDRKARPHAQPRERKTTAVGSGFIIDPEGLVVTNYHVIDGADEIEVVFADGTRRPATLKGHDKKTDLALLKITADKPLPFVKFGDSDSARVGDWVIAIGNPFGLGGTTTSGIISARGRDIQAGPLDDFIQIDAPINRGNSGGPLFNTSGEVIGVNSAIYSPNGGSVGIAFAIPSSMASNVIAQLRDTGIVKRGFLGIYLQKVSAEIAHSLGLEKSTGALVTKVIADSPAEKAGIEAGDVILNYDRKEVSKMRDLPKFVALTKNNTEVNIQIWRNNQRKTLRVTIGNSEPNAIASELPGATAETGDLGLSVGALNDESREKYGIPADTDGVVVIAVAPNGSAAGQLQAGDLIKRIDNTPIHSPQAAKDALQASRKAGKKTALLLIERDQQTRFVVVPMHINS